MNEANLKALCGAYHYVVVDAYNQLSQERQHIRGPIEVVIKIENDMMARIAKRVEEFKLGNFMPLELYPNLRIDDEADLAQACHRLGILYSHDSIVDFVQNGKVTKADSEEE